MRIVSPSKILLLSVLFLVFSLKTGHTANNQEESAYQRANVYYEQANYDEAIKEYESIIKSGLKSGNLYYNLGNCYFKKGELGKAILNYELARRFIPQDKDLESNLEFACSLIQGSAEAAKNSFLFRALDNSFGKFTIDGLTILLSVLYALILVTILTGLFLRQFKKKTIIMAVVIGIIFIAGFLVLNEKISLLNKEAIVITKQVDARFEPFDKATVYFSLYEGMKVEILATNNNWYKIKRPDNKSGWVESNALAVF